MSSIIDALPATPDVSSFNQGQSVTSGMTGLISWNQLAIESNR